MAEVKTKVSKCDIDMLQKMMMQPQRHQEVTFQDQLFQEYQAGYHKGYEHGIKDASELTAEDVKLISDLEFYELNKSEDTGCTLEEIRSEVAKQFNEKRYKNMAEDKKNKR